MADAYIGTFVKKDGTERTMTFCRVKDIPDEYVATKISGEGKPRKLPEGMELVLDLVEDDWRIFNWKTVVGEVSAVKLPSNYFQ